MGKKRKKQKKLSLQQFQEMTLTDKFTNKSPKEIYTNHTLRNKNLNNNQSDLPTEPSYKPDDDDGDVKPKHEESSNWRKNDSKTFTDINNNITSKAESSKNWRNDDSNDNNDNKQNTTIYRRPKKNYNESVPIHHNWRNDNNESKPIHNNWRNDDRKPQKNYDWRNDDNKQNTTIYRKPQKNYNESEPIHNNWRNVNNDVKNWRNKNI